MIEVETTEDFDRWFSRLRDKRAQARVAARVRRLAFGLFGGDVKPVGEGVSELKVDYGPGYRVYFIRRGERLIVVLAGGDKTTQGRDIGLAKQIASELE